MSNNKDRFTVICACKEGPVMKFDHVKESATSNETFQICTDGKTYIFPLCNLLYAELIKEGANDEYLF